MANTPLVSQFFAPQKFELTQTEKSEKMKFTLALFIASFATFANGARYGLLRVGTPAATATKRKHVSQSNTRSLFEEDFQA